VTAFLSNSFTELSESMAGGHPEAGTWLRRNCPQIPRAERMSIVCWTSVVILASSPCLTHLVTYVTPKANLWFAAVCKMNLLSILMKNEKVLTCKKSL
jgi:hypothetical protein